MARNVRLVTGASESELARQQQLADALTARSMRPVVPPPSGGPMTTALSPWQGLAQLGEAFVAGRLNRVLAQREKAQQDEQRQSTAAKIEALTRSPMLERMDPSGRPNGQSVAPPQDFETGAPMLSSKGELLAAAMRGMEPGAAGQVLSQELFARALPPSQTEEGFTLAPGSIRYDAQGRKVAEAPQTAKAPGQLYRVVAPDGTVRYATAEEAANMRPYIEQPQGPTGSWSQPFPAVDPATGKTGLFKQHSITGQIVPVEVPGDGSLRPAVDPQVGKPTDTERTAAGFLGRMQAANQYMEQAPAPNFKDWAAYEQVLSGNPAAAAMANQIISPKAQQTFQAQSDWVRAKLRKESGAVIGPQEMINEIRTYFPIPGDSPQTVAQKRAARKQAEQAMALASGPIGAGAPQAPAMPEQTMPQQAGDPVLEDALRRYGGASR